MASKKTKQNLDGSRSFVKGKTPKARRKTAGAIADSARRKDNKAFGKASILPTKKNKAAAEKTRKIKLRTKLEHQNRIRDDVVSKGKNVLKGAKFE